MKMMRNTRNALQSARKFMRTFTQKSSSKLCIPERADVVVIGMAS